MSEWSLSRIKRGSYVKMSLFEKKLATMRRQEISRQRRKLKRRRYKGLIPSFFDYIRDRDGGMIRTQSFAHSVMQIAYDDQATPQDKVKHMQARLFDYRQACESLGKEKVDSIKQESVRQIPEWTLKTW